MIIAGIYSLKGGKEIVEGNYAAELADIRGVIAAIDSEQYRTKPSREKTMPGKMLYSPKALNSAVKQEFASRGWEKRKVLCTYPTQYYTEAYTPSAVLKGAFREMDFVKGRLGVEVQFGKYAFMVYNVCAKMTIFHNLDVIDAGVEIVPIKAFADDMSTGVSYFEQFVWDLETRGIADIDVPVLVLGIASALVSESGQPVQLPPVGEED